MLVIMNLGILEGDATNATEVDFTVHGLDGEDLTLLADGQLANSKGTIYTANSTDVISTITLVNTGAAHNHVNLYLKPTGGTSRRLIPKDLQLEAGYSLHFDGKSCSVVNTSGKIITAGTDGVDGADGLPITAAAGTVDAITANYSPDITLADMKVVAFVASGANTSTTPTFAPDGLTAHPITKHGGTALGVGDIPAALSVCIVQYNLSNTRWELLNPATVGGGGSILEIQVFL